MKRLLPHLVYWTLIIGLGIFLWRRFESESQQIALLNQPTDEAMVAIERANQQTKSDIKRYIEGYRTERNIEVGRKARTVDSLIAASFTDPAGRDSLSPRLWALTDQSRELAPYFQKILPSKNQTVNPIYYQNILTQNDSLRRTLLRWQTLRHFAMQVNGCLDIRFDSYQPVASFSTLCPRVGEPFEMEVLLSAYSPRADNAKLSVNGQSLLYEDGLAHFKQTFRQGGIYPLQVKAEYQPNWESDTLIAAEKTFYLHVNR